MQEIKELYKEPCQAKGITCSMHTGPEKLSILADENQIKQVLINLVKNAMEAMEGKPDPKLDLAVKRILNHVSVEISDNGSGIPTEVLEKIFVPFYSTKPEGSGIGLSLSRQIIRNHKGQIVVESEDGSGTTFRVMLPVN
jgi:signal transduction histidine kinase